MKDRKTVWGWVAGAALGVMLTTAFMGFWQKSSSNDACTSCHFHPEAEQSWKMSSHYDNGSGTATDCAACHLPPIGTPQHFLAKTRMGLKDLWSSVVNKKEDIDWERKKELEYAQGLVSNASCVACHVNLFPRGVSDDGIAAHLYYEQNAEKLDLQCISCHLDVGHYNPNYMHARMVGVPTQQRTAGPLFDAPATVTRFETFTEQIPRTDVTLRMIAIPGGTFAMGSSEKDAYSRDDEYPRHDVTVSPFFMSETEVTWDQYWAFYSETMSEGRTAPETVYENNRRAAERRAMLASAMPRPAEYDAIGNHSDVDAVTGPTPPFGNPDQGWGMGDRPAITMTHYAAETFCLWLSLKTGRHYRLPTEAEWEYAARGGTATPYFFEGKPERYTDERLWNRLFGADTTVINGYAVYAANSRSRTQEPSRVKANPFGLKNMAGNVMEYCADWYGDDVYAVGTATDPQGPASGSEHVVRGGSYRDDAVELRSAARSHTHHDDWLRTDPQNPKSIWWYSDVKGIGFRVVCDVPDSISATSR